MASELGAGDWHEDPLGTHDPLPDDLSPGPRSALEPHLRPRQGEKERAVVIQRLTVVKATPPGSDNLEYYVFRSSGRLDVRRRLSEEGRRKAFLAVAAVVVVLVLVLVLAH